MVTNHTFFVSKASTKVPGAFDLESKIVKIEHIPASQAGADDLSSYFAQNTNPNCAAIAFAPNAAVDVTDCNLLPKSHYDLVKLDGDRLNYGDCMDTGLCATADSRPTTLSDVTYVKARQ